MDPITRTRTFGSRTSMSSIALMATWVIMGCGVDPKADRSASGANEPGRIAVALSGGVAAFQIDVVAADASAAGSRFVSLGNGATAEAFFTLPPGDFTVTATPATAPGVPDPACSPVTGHATVVGGRTVPLMLIARCIRPGTGGLDVIVGTNTAPRIDAIGIAPPQSVGPCDKVTVTVGATDVDGDPLAFHFSASGGTASQGVAAFTLEPLGNAVAFTAAAAGDYILDVQACDALGCAHLEVPIHILGSPAGCVLSCDDQNPCTTDTQTADGTCRHATVADGPLCTGGSLHVKLLGFNDFHGRLDEGLLVTSRPVGGAAVLASYLENAQRGVEDQTIIVHAGDLVGASPPDSALLQDEPSIQILNLLANNACSYTDKMNPACNVVGTPGNHEFDEGRGELLRLLTGGNFATGPFLEDPYRGARLPYVSANVVDAATNAPLLPPYVIKSIHGIPVAFIGAVLKGTPTIVTPTGVAGLAFLDEPTAINSYVPELKAKGVHAIVVTIHQGGFQASYIGATRPTASLTSGPEITDIVNRLDDEIDVVVSGHTHAFTNAFIPNAHGKPILVTQAFANGTAYDDIDLLIDPVTHDVVSKSAQVVTTFGDVGPGLTPDPMVTAIVKAADDRVGPLVNRIVGTAVRALSRAQNAAGEQTMGDFIADAQRDAMQTDVAFMNPGGIRADLDAGEITWGELFTIQPFGNSLVRMNLTGQQIYDVLEQQWLGQTSPRIMAISGFTYTWDPARPVGSRVLEVRRGGVVIDNTAVYTATCNNFMAAGGDNFTTFVSGTNRVGGPIDLDALVEYTTEQTPIDVALDGRITTP